MKRAENCVDCKIDHIYIENDSLVFHFAKSKGIKMEKSTLDRGMYLLTQRSHGCVLFLQWHGI